jgi:hypothetical protein
MFIKLHIILNVPLQQLASTVVFTILLQGLVASVTLERRAEDTIRIMISFQILRNNENEGACSN